MSDERVRALLREIERELAGTGRTVLDFAIPAGGAPRLSVRALNALDGHPCMMNVPRGAQPDVDRVMELTESQIAHTRHLGAVTIREIQWWLRYHGKSPEWAIPLCRVTQCRYEPLKRLHGMCAKHGSIQLQ